MGVLQEARVLACKGCGVPCISNRIFQAAGYSLSNRMSNAEWLERRQDGGTEGRHGGPVSHLPIALKRLGAQQGARHARGVVRAIQERG